MNERRRILEGGRKTTPAPEGILAAGKKSAGFFAAGGLELTHPEKRPVEALDHF